MALLDTISSVVRLPLRVAGKAVGVAAGTVAKVVPGRSTPPTAPLPTEATPAPAPAPATRETPLAKDPAQGPIDPPAPAKKSPATKAAATKTAAKKTAAKKTTAKKAAAKKLPPPIDPALASTSTPVTDIDAAVEGEQVDVTPADVADAMGTGLDEQAPPASS